MTIWAAEGGQRHTLSEITPPDLRARPETERQVHTQTPVSKVRLCTHNLPEFRYHAPRDLQRSKNAEAYLNDTLAKAVTTGENGQSYDPRG